MSHWFHRNPLKATTTVTFDLSMVAAQPEAIQICAQLKSLRSKLIELFCDSSNGNENVEKVLKEYLSLLSGLVTSGQLDDRHGPSDSSKLRHYIRFKWSNSVLGSSPTVQQDAAFEVISILYEYAIWLMKHASFLASKDDISMDEAKDVHKCLRKAAGVITVIQKDWTDRLLSFKPEPGSDLDPRVMNAYIQQCQAEAQEVTIARAIELKHSHSLVSALANETSKIFFAAASALKALDTEKFGKWMTYLLLKSAFYEAYAFCFLGESLLEQEKCGESIRALQESERAFKTAERHCKEYGKMKAVGTSAKIDQHLFFRKLRPQVTRTMDKCVRENGFIFHQKVPPEAPALEFKATHGLVEPEEFTIPPIHQLWTPKSYSAFDLSKNINPNDPANSKAAAVAEGPLPPVKEKNNDSSSKDPKNNSGCSVQ